MLLRKQDEIIVSTDSFLAMQLTFKFFMKSTWKKTITITFGLLVYFSLRFKQSERVISPFHIAPQHLE